MAGVHKENADSVIVAEVYPGKVSRVASTGVHEIIADLMVVHVRYDSSWKLTASKRQAAAAAAAAANGTRLQI